MDGFARRLRSVETLANMMSSVVCESAPDVARDIHIPTEAHCPLVQTDSNLAPDHQTPQRALCHLVPPSSPTALCHLVLLLSPMLSSTSKVRSNTHKTAKLDLLPKRQHLRARRSLPLPLPLPLPPPLLLSPLPPLHPLQSQALAHWAQPPPCAPP